MSEDGKNKTILVVDDSLMIRRIVGMILKEYNYEVLTAENGLAGLEMAKANLPDLIIMDVTMPVMNGIEAAAKIKADPETAHIPILIFTSLGSEHDFQAAQAAGVSGFLNKPIAKEELKSAVFSLLSDRDS
ncbi:MAG: response regulator [Syntrophorhabdaceae bacterium]|nr:response regulator [Syntrophorhabdaceae bacterium]